MKLTGMPNLEIDDKEEYIKSLETSVRLLQKEVDTLRSQISTDKNSEVILSGASFNFFEFSEYSEIIEKLHELINDIIQINECNVLFLDASDKLFSFEGTYFSDMMNDNINYLEEEGITDWVLTQNNVKVIPNLNLNGTSVAKFFIIVPLFIKNIPVGICVAGTDLAPHELTENQYNEIFTVCNNASIAIDNIRSKKEINVMNNKLNELQKKMVSSAKLISKAEIANVITNEISEPLKVMEAHLEMLESGIGDTTHRVQTIKLQFEKFRSVIEKLNELSEYRTEETLEDHDLKNILDSVFSIISSQLQRDGIKLQMQFDSHNLIIKCQRSQIEQLFIDIFLFQRDRMPDGGKISLNCSIARNIVSIIIIDDAIGVDDINEKNIFEPINEEGFGNLYFVKQIIEKHKGKITVMSDSNTGNTFKILLPLLI